VTKARRDAGAAGALAQRLGGLHPDIDRPVGGQHRDADEAAQQRERIEQAEEAAGVERPQVVVEMERHALQHIAERDAEDQRRHEAADEQRPVPDSAPCGVVQLAAELERDRAQDQRQQHHEHREVEAGERRRIERRPGRERGAAAEDEPDLALPHRPDRVDGAARSMVRPRNGSRIAVPRSKPSKIAKPMIRMPGSAYQMTRRIS
jgi:hypothetical protein